MHSGGLRNAGIIDSATWVLTTVLHAAVDLPSVLAILPNSSNALTICGSSNGIAWEIHWL